MNEASTPSQRLLAAADLLDQRANEATAGPWRIDSATYPEVIYAADDSSVIAGSRWGGEANVFDNNADASYIATMHPGVGKAVATWLRQEGLFAADRPGATIAIGERRIPSRHAVAVADLVLSAAAVERQEH